MTPNKWVWLQAAAQHAGCGQGEKSFFSPPGGLYTSLMCLWPTMSVAPPLSLVVALAVAKVLGTVCTLKWVNDVYWGDKKICGVLIHRYWGKTHHPCIISFGLNINALGEKTPDNREITSLIHHTGRSHDIHQIYSAIQDQIFAYFKEIIAHDGALSPNLCQSLNNRLTAYGKKVRIQTQDGQVTGWCHGLAPSGRIILDSGHEYDVIGLGIVNEMRL
jgi:BirA family biotin operon repressor/biotin-[acetyl-CoA-carboxylase] ligase